MNSIDWVSRAENLSIEICNVIDGSFSDPGGDDGYSKLYPRDGSPLYTVPEGCVDDVDRAVKSARRAVADGRWSSKSVSERKQILHKLSELMESRTEALGLRESMDVGKTISDAIAVDVPFALNILKCRIEACDKFYGSVHQTDSRSLVMEKLGPRGVVAGIVGWNFPLVLAMIKIAPALATGNCVVLKPSEMSSLSAAFIAELALEAGVPPGVLNVIHGSGSVAGAALASHPDVDLLSFTGSSATGKKLLIASGESNMKRLILECGGKSPNIVFDDIDDMDGVVDAVIQKAFWNQGQVCTSGSRLLLHKNIKDQFLQKLVAKTAALTPADPLQSDSRFGALVSSEHISKVLSYINAGEREGAVLCQGGRKMDVLADGFYLEPAIFDDVCSSYSIAQDEIFGPVLSVMSFDDEAHALSIANDTIYGLSSTVWTRDLQRANTMVEGIDAGEVYVRATTSPSLGAEPGNVSIEAHGQSGFGFESGLKGLQSYTISKSVHYFV